MASRILAPGDFGLLAFAQSILLLSGFVLQAGVPWSLTREMVPANEQRRGELFRGALIANLGLAGCLAAVIALLFVSGPLRSGFEQPIVLVAVLLALPGMAVAPVARAMVLGRQAFGLFATIQATEVTGKAVSGIAMALAGFGAIGAVGGFAVGGIAGAILGLGLVVVGGLRPLWGQVALPRLRLVGPMFAGLLGLALVLNLDLLAVKLLVPDRAVTGEYQAAIILANAPYFLVSSALVPILFTRLARRASLVETRGQVGNALRVGVALALPIELLLMTVPGEVLALFFPSSYTPAASILRLMAIGNAGLIVVVIVGAAFQAVDRAWESGRILLTAVAAEIAVLALVVPHYGALGAVVTFDAAAISSTVILTWRYIEQAEIDAERAVPWAARFILAIGGGFAFALVGRSIAGVAGGIAVGGALYYFLALKLRLVSWPRIPVSTGEDA